MVVQHNISAMNANRYYGINNTALAGSLEKLSSGFAINRAGDNAAGLAVSEKMRAQIGGLTQASKNAEDGISMVQTFEGALQETDSILQRMRSLAVQSANGSYQDDVDREAMQLEFDQLNDELNQIADTDFNGVVMLNGGQMADGLKATNGKFDYANSTRAAKQLSASEINTLDTQGMDDPDATNVTKANAFWKDLGFDRSDTTAGNDGPDSIDITFKYDASKGTWSADSATGGVTADNLKNVTVNTTGNNGGFQVGSTNSYNTSSTNTGGGDNMANVVLDGTTLQNGDTITIRFNNPKASNTAIENIGVSEVNADGLTEGTAANAANKNSNLKVEVSNETYKSTWVNKDKTDGITKDMDKLFDKLNGATVSVTYQDEAGKGIKDISITTQNEDGTTTITELVKDGEAVDGKAITAGSTSFGIEATAEGEITIKSGDNELVTMTADKNEGADGAKGGAEGTINYTLAVDKSVYSDNVKPSAEVVQPESQVSVSNAFNQSKATMTYSDHLGLQVGARTKDLVDFSFSYSSNGLGDLKANMNCSSRTDGLGTADLSIADQKSANAAIDKIDNALNKVSMVRATFGAAQNRLEHKINTLDTNNENLTAAESRIRDTQMDKEMMKFTSSQILSQASQSMLAQANSLPQGVLQLLG